MSDPTAASRSSRLQLLSGARVGLSALSLVTAMQLVMATVIARSLDPAAFGGFAVAAAVVGLLAMLSTHFGQQAERLDDLSDAATLFGVAGVFGLVLLVAVGAATTVAGDASLTSRVLRAYLPTIALTPALSVVNGLAAAVGGRALLAARLGRASMRLVLVLAVAASVGLTPERVGMIDSVVAVTAALVAASVLSRSAPRHGKPVQLPVRDVLAAGLVLAVVAATNYAIQRLDLFMLAGLEGSEAAGRYDVALKLAAMPLLLYSATLTSYVPSLTSIDDGPALRQHYAQASLLGVVVTIPAAVGFSVFGDVAVEWLFGSAYSLPAWTYVVLGGSIAVHALFGPNGATLVSRHRQRALLVFSVAAVIVNGLLNLVLIPRYSVGGAAFATLISYLGVNLATGTLARRHVGQSYRAGEWLRPGLALAATAGGTSIGVRLVVGATRPGLLFAAATTVLTCLTVSLSLPSTKRVIREFLTPSAESTGHVDKGSP